MPRTPGSGRQRGTQNRLTSAFKDAVKVVYEDIGGHAAFATWARENRTEFYKIASRLIPVEVKSSQDNTVRVVVQRFPVSRSLVEHGSAPLAAIGHELASQTHKQ